MHPVTRFPGELFPAIRHARRAERMNGCSLVRATLPRRDGGGRARVDSSFSGLLSSGMRHFNPKNARHVEIRTLSRSWLFCRVGRISVPIFGRASAFSLIDCQTFRSDNPRLHSLATFSSPIMKRAKRFPKVFIGSLNIAAPRCNLISRRRVNASTSVSISSPGFREWKEIEQRTRVLTDTGQRTASM